MITKLGKFSLFGVALAAALAVIGCGGSGPGSDGSTSGATTGSTTGATTGTTGFTSNSVRSLLAYPAAHPVNFYLDTTEVAAQLQDRQLTPYAPLPASHMQLVLKDALNNQLLAQAPANLGTGNYTLLGYQNDSGQTATAVLSDDLTVSAGQAKVRFVNAAAGQGPVDVYVVSGFLLAGTPPTFSSVRLGTASDYFAFAPQGKAVYVMQAGTQNLVLTAQLDEADGQVRSVIMENSSSGPVGLVAADKG